MIALSAFNSALQREPLRSKFGFKGGYLTELWQSVAYLQSRSGHEAAGVGTQSVLWSDPAVFAEHSEAAGNALMFAVLEFALAEARNHPFETPLDLLDALYPKAYTHGQEITGRTNLRRTFALNALVPLDNAAWILYAREHGFEMFDEMIPASLRRGVDYRHEHVASIPTIGYGMKAEPMRALAEAGYFVIKVKLGHPGEPEEMIASDARLLRTVHETFSDVETPYTESGRVAYYLDINGRYDTKDQLRALLDAADEMGALEQITLVEEPFPEEFEEDVSDLGVRIAADESAHTDADARRLIDMGYGAIALKPVAKTTSMTLRIAAEAADRGVPCFCADLTANPILVDWNKCFAARLRPLPGLEVGMLETNGAQNYANWERMREYHPAAGASWMTDRGGLFHLDDAFYRRSAGILEDSPHYLSLAKPDDR